MKLQPVHTLRMIFGDQLIEQLSNLASMAAKAGMSRARFANQFRAVVGITPGK